MLVLCFLAQDLLYASPASLIPICFIICVCLCFCYAQKTQHEGGIRELDRLWSANSAVAEGIKVVLRQVGPIRQGRVPSRSVPTPPCLLLQVASILDEEAAADGTLRAQYRERWTAAPSDLCAADLRGDVAKYSKVRCACVCM